MVVFEIVIALLLGGAALTGLSKRIGAPYPALLALAGTVLALIPGTPTLVLDPELALALFVAPVLLDAAFDSSVRDLLVNWRSVAGLALGAVVLTVVAVAVVVRWFVPAMPWSVAVALGAIVAPPDAAAASAVLKQLRPPHRLLVILEGESLFNDASSLLIYRVAVGAAIANVPLSRASVLPPLLFVTIGSVVLALVLSRLVVSFMWRIQDPAIATVVQFCSGFGIWILAERLHLSGILTMVVFAMATARRVGALVPASVRIPSYAVWEFAVFVLNVLAFILVGFQLKGILDRIDGSTLARYAVIAIAVCSAAIVARIVWVYATRFVGGHFAGRAEPAKNATVVAWCGMRGIVTLAAALALPAGEDGGAPFPYRDLVLFTSFAVVVGTLVIQGMSLRPLMTALRLEDDGALEREIHGARGELLRAGLAAVPGDSNDDLVALLRRRYEFLLRREDEDAGSVADVDTATVRTVISARRNRLVALRAEGTIGDGAFQRLEQELDMEELHLQQLMGGAEGA